jgi:putative endonuclease
LRFLCTLADRARDRARQRRWDPDLATGRRGEDLAHRFLQSQGFIIVARNWRPRAGGLELDIVAWEKDALVFCEVKTRASEEYGSPDRAVDLEKRKHIVRAAREYARRAGVDWNAVRFDLVNVVVENPVRLNLLRDAFRPAGLLSYNIRSTH